MQAIENAFEFIKNGVLFLRPHNRAVDVVRIIKQLNSPFAFVCIHTIDVSVDTLREYTDLWDALKVFMRKTNNVTNLLLFQYDINVALSNNINAIVEILCEFKSITNLGLILANDEYSADEICALRKYFDGTIAVKNVQLKSNFHMISNIMESIKLNETIETVDLTIINAKDDVELTSALITHKIRQICFLCCRTRSDCTTTFNTFLESFLASNPTLRELKLFCTPMGTVSVKIIAAFVKTHNNLTTLYMRHCNINNKRIAILAQALETSNVENLCIDDNDIEYDGAMHIASMLKLNNSLKTVDISNNPITYEGALDILKVLAINTSVSEFYCADAIYINDETIESVTQTFEQILLRNHTLTYFFVRLMLGPARRKQQVCIKLKNITRRNTMRTLD